MQNLIDRLPESLSYAVYYWVQRKFGRLKHVTPVENLCAGMKICDLIHKKNADVTGKTVLEIGTGRRINVPLVFWLNGAEKVYSVDINPYLTYDLVRQDLAYIKKNKEEIIRLFDQRMMRTRFESLLDFDFNQLKLSDLLELCNIEYIAPADAASLDIECSSIDFHISFEVFQNIPPAVLENILLEGNRLLQDHGLFVHRVDYSDHFAHTDKSISSIHFLQFNEQEWRELANSKYMYMNRLRVDDFKALFQRSQQEIIEIESDVSPKAKYLLENSLITLDERFQHKSIDDLSTAASWFVLRKKSNQVTSA